MKGKMNKDQWVAMFQELGLNEATMRQWHHIFENRHPEGHQSFLEWLGIADDEIKKIRQASR